MDQHKSFRETHNCIGFYGSFTFSPHHWPLAYSGTRSTLLYVALHDLTRHLCLTILSTLYLYARLNYLLSISTFVSILSSSSSLYSPSQWGAVDSLPPLRVLSRTCTVTSANTCVCSENRTNGIFDGTRSSLGIKHRSQLYSCSYIIQVNYLLNDSFIIIIFIISLKYFL